MPYQPQYVDFSEIPVQIPDDYDFSDKRQALEIAEVSAELDLNDGAELTKDVPDKVMSKVRVAIKQKATANLISSAESPDDVTLGDLEDGGTNKSDYGDNFDERYNTIITKIRNSDVLDDTQDDSAYTYTTHQGNGGY